MSACYCEQCAPEHAAPTYTRRFQRECFLRAVAAMPFGLRRGFLERYAKRHGEPARQRLEVALRKQAAIARTPAPVKDQPRKPR